MPPSSALAAQNPVQPQTPTPKLYAPFPTPHSTAKINYICAYIFIRGKSIQYTPDADEPDNAAGVQHFPTIAHSMQHTKR